MTLKVVNNSDPGTADTVGGNDWDEMATGINLGEDYKYLIAKSGSTYYVKDSVGSIVTSNSEPAIVLQYAITNAAGLGKVKIRNGTYTVNGLGNAGITTQILTIPSNSWIEGEDMYNTKIVLGGSVTDKNLIQNSNTTGGNTNIVLKNLYFDATAAVSKNNVALSRVQNIKLINIYCKNGASGVYNCYVTGGRDAGGIPNAYVSNSEFTGCIFESHQSCAWDNFAGGLITDSTISNCVFFNSGGSAGFAQRLMTDTTMTNCISYDSSSSGFNIEAAHGCVISNCIAHDCSDTGFKALYVSSGGPPVDGFPLNNQFDNCKAYLCHKGYEIEGQYNTLNACNAYSNTIMGIRIYGDYNLISACHSYNNGTDTGQSATNRTGIKLDYAARSGYTYVGKNVVQNCYTFDNQGTATQQYGINELTSTVNNNLLQGNKVWGNATTNISTTGAASKTLNNTVWNGTAWVANETVPSRIQFSVGQSSVSSTVYGVRYASGFNTLTLGSTEANTATAYPYAFTVKRLMARMVTNTLNGATVVSFRDDAADVTGATVTITAASTAEFDSGAISQTVAAGSAICFKIDTSASSSGNWLLVHAYVIAEVLI